MTAACDAIRAHLAAHVDGEVTPLGREAVGAHLAACEACRAAAAELADYRAALARAYRPEPAPGALAEALGRLAPPAAPRPAWPDRPGRRLVAPALAGLAMLAAAGVVATALLRRDAPPRQASPGLAEVTVRQHDALASARAGLEFVTSDRAALLAWFAGRLPVALELPRLDSPELELLGGRVVEVAGGAAAYVAYRRGEAVVSLGVASEQAGAPPLGAQVEAFRSLRFHLSRLGGHNVISWSDRGLAYALVSDLPAQGRASCAVCHAPGSGLRGVEGFHR